MFTECTSYRLARPGAEPRELKIANPSSFSRIAALTAANLSRLLRRAASSKFSKSRPAYAAGKLRALDPVFSPSNLPRERALARAGSSFLLKADISHFYPSLYTHAVGWAIDPKLRNKANWKNTKLLGKQVDQALMDADGKISQGIPIGNDISFLLAEVVLAQVDKAVDLPASQSFRWFDDYEFSFATRTEAESALRKLTKELGAFRLRLNPQKTKIVQLPQPVEDEWRSRLIQSAGVPFRTTREMVNYFDDAFRLRQRFPDAAVLSYALGVLFRLKCPKFDVGAVAQSYVTQAVLCEPGSAQKAFALLTFWHLNGLVLDAPLMIRTVDQVVLKHRATGVSSDVAWALAFCLDHQLAIGKAAAKTLSVFDDDCVALQSLHLNSVGLMPSGFSTKAISSALRARNEITYANCGFGLGCSV